MRKLTKQLLLSGIALVLLTNLIALAQYRSGPSQLARTCNLAASAFTNMATYGYASFPVSATGVDLVISAYNADAGDVLVLDIGVDKSMDNLVWSNALVIHSPTGAQTAGARMYLITNVSVGNYGWARVRGITNILPTTVTNIQVIGTHK